MFRYLKNTGKFILGIFLFVLGIGLFYLGCQYNSSAIEGIFKKLDAVIYIICFGTSIFGLDMIISAFRKKELPKKQEAPVPDKNTDVSAP